MQANLLTFDFVLVLIFLGDYFLITRHRSKIFSPLPPVLLVGSIAVHTFWFQPTAVCGTVQFLLTITLISACALFAYYNMVAFIKRGITFAILLNHARRVDMRDNDETFIDLRLRIREMQDHGWIVEHSHSYSITASGSLVLAIYRFALRVLGIEPIG
jgi:hypothetical protein